jgi:hypothetical protein
MTRLPRKWILLVGTTLALAVASALIVTATTSARTETPRKAQERHVIRLNSGVRRVHSVIPISALSTADRKMLADLNASGPLTVVAESQRMRFMTLAGHDGATCFATGLKGGSSVIAVLHCPAGTAQSPVADRVLDDQSIWMGNGRALTLERGAGFAASSVATVSFVTSGGAALQVGVVHGAYELPGAAHSGIVAIQALNAQGTKVGEAFVPPVLGSRRG